ncbi:hypothetical protein KIW84_041431 [Lathyrus oleraceus]|uniref:Uncharacterized protein n=1 Tax=Pisum sativum TaxID=3888 RepID=A0A9D5AS13_PEA|nr:hypothetical protein KIW84_041431 [Pisum sativum]
MMFSSSTPKKRREIFSNALKILTINKINTYLGLPTAVGKSKSRCFSFLLDRLRHKLSIWKENLLSYAGIMTMIKAVARAIPSYVMSSFLIPKIICNKMESLTGNQIIEAQKQRRRTKAELGNSDLLVGRALAKGK